MAYKTLVSISVGSNESDMFNRTIFFHVLESYLIKLINSYAFFSLDVVERILFLVWGRRGISSLLKYNAGWFISANSKKDFLGIFFL